ncbi:hypothetical protein C4577_04975 [Candidatus Parcubacteria bacterium]|nr:MAG: hypothetical protein C4577_04975 [Candidatus Parcubacteria bacterium]
MREYIWQNLPEWDGDKIMSLEDIRLLVIQLQAKYGKRALIEFDAGYNNVITHISPTKKHKKDKPK